MAKIYSPTPADSHRISEIYITSMRHNAILLLQYPTEEQQRQVQEYAATQFQSSIEKHPETTIVVRELDEENGDIMSFLKYEIHQEAKPEEPSKPTADLSSHNDNDDWYHRYLQVTAAARARNMRQPYIHLNLLCTMPRYQGRGAAHVLIGHLKRIAMETKLPIYIESTMNAVGLYEKLGWKHIDWIRMTIPKEPAGPPEVEYQERCMVWEP